MVFEDNISATTTRKCMATTNMLSSTPILSLSQEIIVAISFHLTTPDLGLFRRSCKQIERYLFNSFTKEFFTKRQFLIEHESLEALLGIANHPGLAPCLQDVIIDVRIFGHMRNIEYARFMEARLQSGHLNHEMLLYTGKALAMLTEIFSKLTRLRSVGIRDANGYGRYRDGERAYWRPWGWSCTDSFRDTLVLPPTINHVLPLIMSALTHAHARPTKLEVLLRSYPFLGRDAFAIKDTIDFTTVLSNLKLVHLRIGKSHVESNMLVQDHSEHARFVYQLPIINFLHSLKALEQLRLNFDVWDRLSGTEDALLAWLGGRNLQNEDAYKSLGGSVIPALDFKMLTTLEIGSVAISAVQLTKILVRFSLKSFALWKVILLYGKGTKKDDNCWSLLLTELSKQLPKPSIICKILIGCTGQAPIDRISIGMGRYNVSWRPSVSPATKILGIRSTEGIQYDRLHTSENAHNWLAKASNLAFVELGHDLNSNSMSESEEDSAIDDYMDFTDDDEDILEDVTDDEEDDD